MNLAAWAEKADLDRRVAQVTAWATSRQIPVDKVVTGLGSALGGHRRQFLALPGDPSVRRIVVEQRDGLSLARYFGARRKAFNWSVAVLKADIAAWRVTGAQMATPSLRVLRRNGTPVDASVRVLVQRPRRPGVARPAPCSTKRPIHGHWPPHSNSCGTSAVPAPAGAACPVPPRSTSHATRTHLASSARSGPPSSVELTIRLGRAGRAAAKHGREAATRLLNNPETGCKSRDR